MKESGVAEAVTLAATSDTTKTTRPVSLSTVRLSLLSTHPEGYTKGCLALARSTDSTIDLEKLVMPTLIMTGDADNISPPELVYKGQKKMKNAQVKILKDVGHWHVYADVENIADALCSFI
jgi:pimeloyl-ACP methyl ester carboxylesterase